MATLSFNILQGKYDRIPKAILAWNEAHPERIIASENEFAKESFLEAFDDYINRYRGMRLAIINDGIMHCSDATFQQITGLLAV